MPRDPWSNRIVGTDNVAPADLVPNAGNWRRHSSRQRRALTGVMDDVGWVAQITVNQRSGHLVDGHLRLALALERGEPSVPVVYVDLDEGEERLVLATLDPIGALAEADGGALELLLSQIETADGTVRRLLDDLAAEAERHQPRLPVDPDEVGDVTGAVTRRGDTWELGPHRLRCGDATDVSDVSAVVNGEQPVVLWTDPPYGVDYEGANGLTIMNDAPETLPTLLADSFSTVDRVLASGAAFYVAHPAGPASLTFTQAIHDVGWHYAQTLIWVKDTPVLGHSDYHYRHEPIAYGWKGGPHRWFGGRDQHSVFEVARPRRSREHPTMKPVTLVEVGLRNSSTRGDLCLDPFLGSGTTLIAAERLGRRCAGIELDPAYADVAVCRWEHYTGQAATLAGDGRSFTEIAEVRRGR